MRGDTDYVNVRLKNGKFSRVHRIHAERMIAQGEVDTRRNGGFVSNAIFRAAQHGISEDEVRKDQRAVAERIRKFKEKAAKKSAAPDAEPVSEARTEPSAERSTGKAKKVERRRQKAEAAS